jgi:hypothetical protein
MEASFRLDGLVMNAVATAPNGVVGVDTLFRVHQRGERVHARYAGGRVARGWLVGAVRGERFAFRYCQEHTDGHIGGGRSDCELTRGAVGRVRIVERFEWAAGRGANVLQELADRAG